MFELTGDGDRQLALRASFGQCFKAGVAFTCGAIVVMAIAGFLYIVAMGGVIIPLILRSL